MTELQKGIKYAAMAFAVLLVVGIVGGIITTAVSLLSFFDGEGVADEITSYSVSTAVDSIEIDIRAAELTILEGETFLVESNLKHLKVEEKDGCLYVTEKTSGGANYYGAVLTVYLPAGTVLEEACLSTGAGRLTVERLAAKELCLDLGAGEVVLEQLFATESCEINGGAGAVTVEDGALHDLSMEMGVGQLTMTAALTGECDMDMGVGETRLNLLGGKEFYRIKITKGIGSAHVDGNSVSDGETIGDGENRIDIEGGVGSIKVKFE